MGGWGGKGGGTDMVNDFFLDVPRFFEILWDSLRILWDTIWMELDGWFNSEKSSVHLSISHVVYTNISFYYNHFPNFVIFPFRFLLWLLFSSFSSSPPPSPLPSLFAFKHLLCFKEREKEGRRGNEIFLSCYFIERRRLSDQVGTTKGIWRETMSHGSIKVAPNCNNVCTV